jgi:hypothetical protein
VRPSVNGATDAQYGVGNYQDFAQSAPCPYGFELDTDLTTAAAAKAAINTWAASARSRSPRRRARASTEEYQDHGGATDVNVHSTAVTAVSCSRDGTSATIFGTATGNGSGSYTFRIDVKELDEPGTNDRHRVRLSNAYDSGDQQLGSGNIQIH